MISEIAKAKLDRILLSEDDTASPSDEFVNHCDENGICLECGEIHEDIEPDAEGYMCQECGEHAVMGLSMAIITYC